MDENEFQREFERLSPVFGPGASDYSDFLQWEALGIDSRDVELTQVADIYLQASREQREAMQCAVDCQASWLLLIYIRRVALLMLIDKNTQWYWRGLAIAHLKEDNFGDYDDIVSLNGLNACGELIGVDQIVLNLNQSFEEAILNRAYSVNSCPVNIKKCTIAILECYGPAGLLALKAFGVPIRT